MTTSKPIDVYTRPRTMVQTRLSFSRRLYMAAAIAFEFFMKKDNTPEEIAIAKVIFAGYKVKPRIGPGRVTVDSASRQDRSVYTPRIDTPKLERLARRAQAAVDAAV